MMQGRRMLGMDVGGLSPLSGRKSTERGCPVWGTCQGPAPSGLDGKGEVWVKKGQGQGSRIPRCEATCLSAVFDFATTHWTGAVERRLPIGTVGLRRGASSPPHQSHPGLLVQHKLQGGMSNTHLKISVLFNSRCVSFSP